MDSDREPKEVPQESKSQFDSRAIIVLIFLAMFAAAYVITQRSRPQPEVTFVSEPSKQSKKPSANVIEKLIVQIAGEVKKPGVYELDKPIRVRELIELAGGPTTNAALDEVNIVAMVKDGQRIEVPAKKSPKVSPPEPIRGTVPKRTTNPEPEKLPTKIVLVDLTAATYQELMELPGASHDMVRQIMILRDEKHGMIKLDDLIVVKGIGPETIKRWREHVIE